MDEVFEIHSVMAAGKMATSRSVVVLKLGIEPYEPDFSRSHSYVLSQWGAQAIMDQLYSAGIRPRGDEDKPPEDKEVSL